MSGAWTSQNQTNQGLNQANESLSADQICVEGEKDFYPTIDGFEARSDHISECLKTCGNEGNTVQRQEGKIINGQVPNVNSWPFLVKMYFKNSAGDSELCGGTILNNRHRFKLNHSTTLDWSNDTKMISPKMDNISSTLRCSLFNGRSNWSVDNDESRQGHCLLWRTFRFQL